MINPLLAIDFYKADHRRQYQKGTNLIYSNFTPRSFKRYKGNQTELVWMGLQVFIKDCLIKDWNEGFFNRPKNEVVEEYRIFMDSTLGQDAIPVEHIAALHDLGYLPILIKSLPEGTLVPAKIPVLTIVNTNPDFFWLVNYLETVMSTELWKIATNATIAYEYKQNFIKYADLTGANKDFIVFQGHDFSARGLSNREDQYKTQISHLSSFVGTDTCLAIQGAKDFYNADYTKELVGTSVPATEHSVMCSNIAYIKDQLDTIGFWSYTNKDGEYRDLKIRDLQFDKSHTNTQRLAEIAYIYYIITELYPTGIVSIVADSFDFWYLMQYGIKVLKPAIEARQPNLLGLAKVVFRPDSGNPVDIICGREPVYYNGIPNIPLIAQKGAIEALWETFGGTVNQEGYKELNFKVGLIYGDSITLDRQVEILERLMVKQFASSNIVLGIGSFTYQYNTRDTFGFAMKATYSEVNTNGINIYKDPATDDGTKKSAKGLLRVDSINGKLVLHDEVTKEMEGGLLQPVFKDGTLLVDVSLSEIRKRINNDN